MKPKHDPIKKKIEDHEYEIKRLQELYSLTTSIRMRNNIHAKIYTLKKEVYMLERLLNF